MSDLAFIDYWGAIDAEMLRLYCIDTSGAGVEPEELAEAQEAGMSPVEFVAWFGRKYHLTERGKL